MRIRTLTGSSICHCEEALRQAQDKLRRRRISCALVLDSSNSGSPLRPDLQETQPSERITFKSTKFVGLLRLGRLPAGSLPTILADACAWESAYCVKPMQCPASRTQPDELSNEWNRIRRIRGGNATLRRAAPTSPCTLCRDQKQSRSRIIYDTSSRLRIGTGGAANFAFRAAGRSSMIQPKPAFTCARSQPAWSARRWVSDAVYDAATDADGSPSSHSCI